MFSGLVCMNCGYDIDSLVIWGHNHFPYCSKECLHQDRKRGNYAKHVKLKKLRGA